MDFLIFFSALLLYGISALLTLRAVRVHHVWHNPLLFPVIFWTLSYPIRYVIVLVKPDIFLDSELVSTYGDRSVLQLSLALIFSALFIITIGVGLRMVLPLRARTLRTLRPQVLRFRKRDQWLVHALFTLYVTAFAYQGAVYGITGLYEDIEDLKISAIQIVLGEIIMLKWFVASICILAFFRTYRRIFLVQTLLVVATVILSAVLTTAKGMILGIIIFVMVIFSMIGRKPPYLTLSALLFIGIAFSAISYQLREMAYYEVRGKTPTQDLISAYKEVDINLADENYIKLVDRITYYGEALLIMMEGSHDRRDDLYTLGSLVEFGNLLPRALWEDRPHFSFNHYVAGAVWKMPWVFAEIPIGRIGEAFYVASWFGVLYGVLYSYLFALICLLWHKALTSIWAAAAWMAVIMIWVAPDAYLTYGLKQLIAVGVVAYALNFVSKITVYKRPRINKQNVPVVRESLI